MTKETWKSMMADLRLFSPVEIVNGVPVVMFFGKTGTPRHESWNDCLDIVREKYNVVVGVRYPYFSSTQVFYG